MSQAQVSNPQLEYDLHHIVTHNAATPAYDESYPQSHPASLYGSPMSAGMQAYASFPNGFHEMEAYGGGPGPVYSNDVYSHPGSPYARTGRIASPPTSLASDTGVRTRSGRKVGRADSVAQTRSESRGSIQKAKSPKPSKKKAAKDKSKDLNLTEPISVFTRDVDVPVKDMEAWVSRPDEVRQKEVEDNNGKIPRPMNSFMLYRSAYADRLKAWGQHNNHQEVSKFAGASWKIEQADLKEHFKNLATMERANHQKAHPDYKFSPSKAGNIKKRGSPDDESDDDGMDDFDDPDAEWAPGGRRNRNKRQRSSMELSTSMSSPYDPNMGMQPQAWPMSHHEVKPLPQSIPMFDPYGNQYYYPQQPLQQQYPVQSMNDFRDQQFQRLSAVGPMPYHTPPPAQPLAVLPAQHDDLYQPPQGGMTPPPSREVGFDPQMMGFDLGFLDQADYPQPTREDRHLPVDFLDDLVDPDLGETLDTGTEFEKWMPEDEANS